MRNVVVVASLVATALLHTGCFFTCGAYDGGGNRVYQRNNAEMLILCDNGGFVARLVDHQVEGFYLDNADGTGFATRGEDGALAFDAAFGADATLSTPQLGDARWTQMNLDRTALDHSDVLCQDLELRTWWAAQ